MDILKELQRTMLEVERESEYKGYWYRVSDILTILICGMLCSLQTIDDIHEWSLSAPAHRFLEEYFVVCKFQNIQ